jgi:exopolyphosphatase
LNPSSIPRIERLLRDGRGSLAKAARAGPLRLVTGSPAADADSAAASTGYALLLSLEADAGTAVLPWLPIPRADLGLRPEVQLLFQRAGLELSGLPCAEEVDAERLAERPAGLELVLVDSDGTWLPPAVRRRIVEVLDHHPGARRPAEASSLRWTVEPVGSTCTLVAEKALARDPGLLDSGLALLLLGPILLDTALFSPEARRSTPRDRAAADRLSQAAGVSQAELYAQLRGARQGLPGLSSRDLLRRDFKGGEAGGKRYGISSSPVPLERWRERDAGVEKAVEGFLEERGLDLLLVMIGWEDSPGGRFRRELGVAARDPRGEAQAAAWLQEAGLDLRELPAASTGAPVRWFSQQAAEVSRKSLEPRLRAWLEGAGWARGER